MEKRQIAKYKERLIGAQKGTIRGPVEIAYPKSITIGKNSYVNGGQLFAGPNSTITIGDNCMVSYNVHIRTTVHNYTDRNLPMIKQGLLEKSIVIEDNVWIGHSAHIMAGVHIGTGSVVGAGAVVTKDVPPNVVVAGVPAKIIKYL